MTGLTRLSFPAALALLALFEANAGATNDEVVHWNRVVAEATAASEMAGDPLTESRYFAIVQVAVHDAVNAIDPCFESYAAKLPVRNGASIPAAIATAAHDSLSELLPSSRAALDAALKESLAAIPDGDAKTAGIEVGRGAAAAILAARRKDGSDQPIDVPPGTKPGEYRPTPPDFTPAWMGHWGQVKPFVLESSAQFRPEPPPAVGSPQALRDIDEIKTAGAQEHPARNPEQTEIARFWYENSTQGWNRIAREVATARHLGTSASARLFALLNVGMADGFIAGFEAKYHYRYWRPATAIRAAGESEWLSQLPTPPVPDYPSTHTVLGATAATILARFFETDFVAFSSTSGAPYAGITRRFWSFSEAARENGASRMLAGIHFRTAVNAGYRQGESVGTWVFEHAMRPLEPARNPVSTSR
jgi:PAP2 superfamily protein